VVDLKKILFILLILILITSCARQSYVSTTVVPAEEDAEKTNEVLQMKKILFVIAQNNFRDEEYLVPKEIFEKNNIEVVTASITTGPATGMLGAIVNPDIAVKDGNIADYDAVVIAGGQGAPMLAEHDEVINLVKEAESKGKVIAAICIAPIILAKAGILEGKKATVFSFEDHINTLKSNGAEYVDEVVVVDGRIITGNGPDAAEEFGNEIARLLLS